ncbi:hypothetical protein [Actinoplanes sp. HUAS TT8]|uniref:hypothetical protein n=1 Tax=Actinoplanes sp. HUAS TT8 TaxID=3447453 RepID=UPI003F520B10
MASNLFGPGTRRERSADEVEADQRRRQAEADRAARAEARRNGRDRRSIGNGGGH